MANLETGLDVSDPIALEGARKARGALTSMRIRLIMLGMGLVFIVVLARLVYFGSVEIDSTIDGQARDVITASRPAILDRNGLELAVDVRVPSLYAEPRRMVDREEAAQKILQVLPELNPQWLRERLAKDKGFVWVKRELTPMQQEKIFRLGLPGIDFLTESRRFYPGGRSASHIMGMVNIDNRGIAGIESHLDGENVALLQDLGLARDRALAPTKLSIDMRVQHALREQLVDALARYQAVASAGAILDVRTGEILAMVSLPDFDPNDADTMSEPWRGKKDERFNRITLGRYELGSTFKTVTMAAALDSGRVKLTDRFDARQGIRFGRYTIDDFHGQHRILSVPEVYKYSSNIGTIKIMQALGKENFRAFLTRAGFDAPLSVELPETITSNIPDKFSDIVAATASFGHGLSVTPLHMLTSMAAFVNGGKYVPATLLPRTEAEANAMARQILTPQTSRKLRYLMRLNALEGSGSRANKIANGYVMGGKTGTAEKVVDGKYSSEKSLTIFASAFPLNDPRYAMIILVDEPKRENERSGRTAGWNAGEVTGRVIRQIAPMLGIYPDFSTTTDEALVPQELGRAGGVDP